MQVIWHQSLLVFVQRYKNDLDSTARSRIKELLKVHGHPQIALEVKRELLPCATDVDIAAAEGMF